MTYIVAYLDINGFRKYEECTSLGHALGFCSDIKDELATIYNIIIL